MLEVSRVKGRSMFDMDRTDNTDKSSHSHPKANTVSRREFLRIAGMAGATVGLGAGLGGLLAGCGGESTTTTAASAVTTTSLGSSTTSLGSSTTATSGPEMGSTIKIGLVSAQTGALAAFATSDKYLLERYKEAAGDGIVCGDGKKHPFEVLLENSQSSSNRAAQVAGDLIQNAKVDMIIAGCAGDTSVPVADQCEALGVPSFTTGAIWQAWFNTRQGDPKVGFKWTYHAMFGTDASATMFFAMWAKVPNNKTYGALWPNDTDGNTYRKLWPKVLADQGWKVVDGGAFSDGNEDYTTIIDKFKAGGAEVCAGLMTPADFTNFWKQAQQQSYGPKICSIGKALNFPEAVNALGDIALGLTAPVYWAPTFPYKSSLTGETCQQLADDFEKRTGQQWSQALHQYMCFEVVVDTFKRTIDPSDKASTVQALKTTKLDTVQGPLDFTAPVQPGTVHPNINCCATAIVGGQWVKGTKWPYDVAIVSNQGFADIPLSGQMTSL